MQLTLFKAGLISSVHCAKSIRPIICKHRLVFSIAEVTAIAWKLPPWYICSPTGSIKGLSVVEFISVDSCSWANKRSSSPGPNHCDDVRMEYLSCRREPSSTESRPLVGWETVSLEPLRKDEILRAASTCPGCGRTVAIKGAKLSSVPHKASTPIAVRIWDSTARQ